MKDTNLVFVVGSGRCGTKMMTKLLAGVDHIEAHHEYVRDAYQRESAMYYMNLYPYSSMVEKLQEIYAPGAYYSPAKIFLDSSHKLAWCMNVLVDAFPTAKFIHLVRDGRKVASSFFYKLNIFDDHAARVLRDWMDGKDEMIPPRPENYWQVLPPKDYNMFQRICWHWVQSNASIFFGLKSVPSDRKLFVKLEDLSTSPYTMKTFLSFLDTDYDESFMRVMQRPDHVYVPVNYKLTKEQESQFHEIAFMIQKFLGYDKDSTYELKY